MRLRYIGISLAVLGLAVSGPIARAQESRDDKFTAWDTNRDGRLEIGEMQANQANFRAMDCNHDGYLSREEFTNRYQCDENNASAAVVPAPVPVPVQDEFWRLDRNRDGVISQGEWSGGADSFRRYDRNNDGRITRDEYSSPLDPSNAEGRFQVEDLNNDGVISRGEWRGTRSTFEAVDLNRDNHVTRDESLAMGTGSAYDSTEERFRALDRNHNGYLSTSEYRGESVPFRVADRDRDDRISLDEYASISSISQSGGYSAAQDQRFRELDRNNDGQLTRYEWRGESVDFNTADRNGDRVVTRDEYMAATGGYVGNDPYRRVSYDPRNERFNGEDRNRDGRISRSELQGAPGTVYRLHPAPDGYLINSPC